MIKTADPAPRGEWSRRKWKEFSEAERVEKKRMTEMVGHLASHPIIAPREYIDYLLAIQGRSSATLDMTIEARA